MSNLQIRLMLAPVEESNDDDDDFYYKYPSLERAISDESQSTSSQSSREYLLPQIKTNLEKAQLAYFQRFESPSTSDVKLFSEENSIFIEFPEIYLNHNVSISVIGPDGDENHDNLKLVSLCKYPIYKGYILFKITPDILKELKLDFFGICFTDNKMETDTDDEYKRNTARLFINIYDNSEKLVTSYKSAIIRNKNSIDLVSDDISLLQIKQDKKVPTNYRIRLKNRVPYFPSELEFKIEGYPKSIYPRIESNFPYNEFIISVPEKIKCTSSNTSIICKTFGKKHFPKKIPKNAIIEKRKMESNKSIHNNNTDTSETSQSALILESKKRIKGQSALILESKKRIKEMCLVINQINFDDKNLKSREVGSENDISEIKNSFSEILNYQVHIFTDSTTQTLKEKIKNKLDHFEDYHDHIVVFVLSHGDNNKFHTLDGSIKYDEFVKLFLPSNCPKISDKPKLFFFSCCQGGRVNTIDKSLIPEGITEYTSASCENFLRIKNHPEYSNIFMGFSTVPDYCNFRVNYVTPYIQTLLDVIKENPSLEIRKIQDLTQSRVNWNEYLTIPSVFHCLTKEVYFKQSTNS